MTIQVQRLKTRALCTILTSRFNWRGILKILESGRKALFSTSISTNAQFKGFLCIFRHGLFSEALRYTWIKGPLWREQYKVWS